MCMCDKPNINGQKTYKWMKSHSKSIYPLNPPETFIDDVILFDEPGRCGGTDSHAFHFIVIERMGSLLLLVKHGGGEDSIRIGSTRGNHRRGIREALENATDSNARYWLMQTLYHTVQDERRLSTEAERSIWSKAAREDRLKIRSRQGQKYAEILPEIKIDH